MSIIDAYDLEELQDKAKRVPILERDLAEARAEVARLTAYRDGAVANEERLAAENERLKTALWHSREDLMGVAQEIDKMLGSYDPTRTDEQ